MTSKDKLIEQFLDNPTKLKYEKIESIMLNVGFSIEWAKGSHKKISYPNLKLHLSIPLHKWDCKDFYKEQLKKFYLNNLK